MLLRVLAVLHVLIAILLFPVTPFSGSFAPLMLIAQVWSIVLAVRMWRRDPNVIQSLLWTHAVLLAADAVLIGYGVWILMAAGGRGDAPHVDSAVGMGIGILGLIVIAIGMCLAVFSTVMLLLASRLRTAAAIPTE
jgi:hypothetical protein